MLFYEEAKEIEELLRYVQIDTVLQFEAPAKAIKEASILAEDKLDREKAKIFLEKLKKVGKKSVVILPMLASSDVRFKISILILCCKREKTSHSIRKALEKIYKTTLNGDKVLKIIINVEGDGYVERYGTVAIRIERPINKVSQFKLTERGEKALHVLEIVYRAYKKELEKKSRQE